MRERYINPAKDTYPPIHPDMKQLNIRIHRDITGGMGFWGGLSLTLKVVQITGAGHFRYQALPVKWLKRFIRDKSHNKTKEPGMFVYFKLFP